MAAHGRQNQRGGALVRAVGGLEGAEDKLQRALDAAGNTYTLDDLRALIAARGAQLWRVNECSVIVTEIIQYPQKRVLNVFLAAGELGPILDAVPDLEAFAKDMKCDWIELTGRRGWLRKLNGWRPKSVTMTKEIVR